MYDVVRDSENAALTHTQALAVQAMCAAHWSWCGAAEMSDAMSCEGERDGWPMLLCGRA